MNKSFNSFVEVKRSIYLYLNRHRCSVCFKKYNDVHIDIDLSKTFVGKEFAIFNRKHRNIFWISKLRKNIASDHGYYYQYLARRRYSFYKYRKGGNVITIDVFCDGCGNCKLLELDINRLNGNNFQD